MQNFHLHTFDTKALMAEFYAGQAILPGHLDKLSQGCLSSAMLTTCISIPVQKGFIRSEIWIVQLRRQKDFH